MSLSITKNKVFLLRIHGELARTSCVTPVTLKDVFKSGARAEDLHNVVTIGENRITYIFILQYKKHTAEVIFGGSH